MKRINWKKLKENVLYTVNVCLYFLYIKQTLPKQPPREDPDFYYLKIPKRGYPYGSLLECSGAKDMETLAEICFAVTFAIINKELQGGSIDIVEPNGIDREKLDLLRHINKDDDKWKD